ncbi:glycosyltransferase family 2 protein [Arcticibacter sp.]|uniref:glycosyltransferase family 2 protein n=1 Tax=Arcticibacter sp. TaxID=1872630 RepID=UPI0038902E83
MPLPSSSLIISTYNWPEALELCLLSVAHQKMLPTEVIIADDGSGENTRKVIERFKKTLPVPVIHVWHNDRGFRKTEILNKAIKESSSVYIIQVDGDVILHPCFISDHLEIAEKNAFVRGTRARLTKQMTEETIRSGKTGFHALSKGVYHRLNAIRLPIFKTLGIRKEMRSRSVRGSNLAFWKSDFVLVNGYNNDLQGWGHEDEELAARFINNRIIKKIVKLSAVQYHLHHEESARDQESFHSTTLDNTVKNTLKFCANGYSCN